MIISKKSWQESIREEQRNYLKTLFHWLTKGNSLKNRSTSGIRTSQVSAGSSSEDCIMGGDARVAAVTAAMMGVTLAITILAVLVELVLGMRRAVARMEVGVVLWIRVTAALEVVAVASPIPEALATEARDVVRVGKMLLSLLLLITSLLR